MFMCWRIHLILHKADLYTYKLPTFFQTPSQNQDDPNVMRSAVIHLGENVSVSIILYGCTSGFDLFSNKLLMLVGLKHICKLWLYHNTIQGDSSKFNHLFSRKVFTFWILYSETEYFILHTHKIAFTSFSNR